MVLFAQFFSAGPRYDAMLHSIFLGFVFSMIFAHAPIILPTITGLAIAVSKQFLSSRRFAASIAAVASRG